MTMIATDRPAGHISYNEAAEATGLSRRSLRRLVSTGKVESVDAGGRRWVSTASLVAAGYRLNQPGPGTTGLATIGTPAPAMAEEIAALRRQLAVAEARAEERLRELEHLRTLTHQLAAMLPAGGTSATDTTSGRPRRWWRR